MKIKSALLLALIFAASATFAQTSNVRKAKNAYTEFDKLKSVGTPELGKNQLMAAKEAIDKAVAHDKTSKDAEAWMFYALIYADLAFEDHTSTGEELQKLAIEGKAKSAELDKENQWSNNLDVVDGILAQRAMNVGIEAWDQQQFAKAHDAFANGIQFIKNDTLLTYYAAIAAVNDQKYDTAIEYYTKLIPIDSFSTRDQVILDVSRIYLLKNDTVNAIKYAEMGNKLYPNNNDLATQYIELNLVSGNMDKVLTNINDQVQRDPNNKNLHYYLGIVYNDSDPKKAEEAYKKAIELDPNFGDAYINLGGVILNRGIAIYNEINMKNITQAEWEKEVKAAYEIFDQALPVLEKAVELNPKNYIAVSNLLKYYQIKEDEAKIKELTALLDTLEY
jgi:tetratricopeptide (TPR) repeat protein